MVKIRDSVDVGEGYSIGLFSRTLRKGEEPIFIIFKNRRRIKPIISVREFDNGKARTILEDSRLSESDINLLLNGLLECHKTWYSNVPSYALPDYSNDTWGFM